MISPLVFLRKSRSLKISWKPSRTNRLSLVSHINFASDTSNFKASRVLITLGVLSSFLKSSRSLDSAIT